MQNRMLDGSYPYHTFLKPKLFLCARHCLPFMRITWCEQLFLYFNHRTCYRLMNISIYGQTKCFCLIIRRLCLDSFWWQTRTHVPSIDDKSCDMSAWPKSTNTWLTKRINFKLNGLSTTWKEHPPNELIHSTIDADHVYINCIAVGLKTQKFRWLHLSCLITGRYE